MNDARVALDLVLQASQAMVPWLALVLSLASFILSRQALRLSEAQEERRKPRMVPYLRDGYIRVADRARHYVFYVSVANPTDSANAIADADLRLSYTTQLGTRLTVKIRATDAAAKGSLPSGASALALPARLDPHQTVAGWLLFVVEQEILRDVSIEGYDIVLVDSHGIESALKPIALQELRSEAETTPGPNCGQTA